MSKYYIVRADFYPDGNIIPLGITDKSGKTIFIDQVQKMERKSFGPKQYEYIFLFSQQKRSNTSFYRQ